MDKSWKAFERRISKLFGGKRRGPYRGSDVIVPGWSIECKLLARPSFGVMLAACRQAEGERDNPQDIPLAIIKRKYDADDDALVCMRLQEFPRIFRFPSDPEQARNIV